MRALERLARWLKPPRLLRPTRAGWSFFVTTFAVGFAALNMGSNLLYLVLKEGRIIPVWNFYIK